MSRRTFSKEKSKAKSGLPLLEESFRLSIEKELKLFKEDDSLTEKSFPPGSLSNVERAFIHELCQTLGLTSKSFGFKEERFIRISKKPDFVNAFSESSKYCHLDLDNGKVNSMSKFLDAHPLKDSDLALLNSALGQEKEAKQADGIGRLKRASPRVPSFALNLTLKRDAENLPIFRYKHAILEAIDRHQVTIISGETGSGKTTQVPKFLLESALYKATPVKIICTEPRRIAAISVSERIAAETDSEIGKMVGYQIRLESQASSKTILTFCTNGILLRTLMGGFDFLQSVSHIIVDEVHERDKFSDFACTVLRDAMKKFPHLKVIIMSATLDIKLWMSYFEMPCHIQIPGRTFPIEDYFLEDILVKYNEHKNRSRKGTWKPSLDQFMMEQEALDEEHEEMKPEDPEFVIEYDAEITEKLNSALSNAFTTNEFDELFSLFEQESIDVNFQHSSTGITALMAAAGHGRIEAIQYLMARGANLHLCAKNGWKAITFAQSQNQPEIVLKKLQFTKAPGMSKTDSKKILEQYHKSFNDEHVDHQLLTFLIQDIHMNNTANPEWAILVFLPGYDEIMAVKNQLESKSAPAGADMKVIMLHSQIPSHEQRKAFTKFQGKRKVILATNIAETSLTIDDVKFVIDTGKVKEKSFDSLTGMTSLQTSWISQNSSTQRKGRAGRTAPGVCYRLYSRARFEELQVQTTPEILKTPLLDLCLHSKVLAPEHNITIEEFLRRTPEPPSPAVIKSAIKLLKTIQALDDKENVTILGKLLVDMPVEPQFGKMILASIALRCLSSVVTIVSCLSYKSPFELPTQQIEGKAATKKYFEDDTSSDHYILLNVYEYWKNSRNKGQFCRENGLSFSTMEMIDGIRSQILAQIKRSGFVPSGRAKESLLDVYSYNFAMVQAALTMGAYPNIARIDPETSMLRTMKEAKVKLHQSCCIRANKGQKMGDVFGPEIEWLIFDEMTMRGRDAVIKSITPVSPLTIALFAGPVSPNIQIGQGETGRQYAEITNWLCFQCSKPKLLEMVLNLRQQWFADFLSTMYDPSRVNIMYQNELLVILSHILNQDITTNSISAEARQNFYPNLKVNSQPKKPYKNMKKKNPTQKQDHHN